MCRIGAQGGGGGRGKKSVIWWDHAGQAPPLPILGTRHTTIRPLAPVEHAVLVCACVDLAIGLRPYIASTN